MLFAQTIGVFSTTPSSRVKYAGALKEDKKIQLEVHNVHAHSPIHSPPTRASSSSRPGIDLRRACSEGRVRRWWHGVHILCAGGTGVYGSDRSVGEPSVRVRAQDD